ncbi:hypothetical protein Rs2_04011 [Raphanus sativus]|nr:hypothetical protein Rs2_04011 [Raphanus sativus]
MEMATLTSCSSYISSCRDVYHKSLQIVTLTCDFDKHFKLLVLTKTSSVASREVLNFNGIGSGQNVPLEKANDRQMCGSVEVFSPDHVTFLSAFPPLPWLRSSATPLQSRSKS